MNLSALFIRRPIATSLLMLAIAVIGIAAYPLLPVAPLPTVDFPTIQVSAQLPGASPDVMASAVATPLEKQLGIIPGVTQITSSSTLGNTQITIQFDLDRNIDAAAQDVQSAINAARGSAAEEPAEPADLPESQSSRCADPRSRRELRRPARSPRWTTMPRTCSRSRSRRFRASPRSSIGGQQQPAVRVQVDPAKLAAKGLTLEDVRGVIAQASVDAAEGHLRRAQAKLHHLRQRPADEGRALQRSRSSPTGTARRSASAISARPSTGRRTRPLAAWVNGSAPSPRSFPSSRAPT